MSKLIDAQSRYDCARATYLSLVRATRPLSRTAREQEEIDWAYSRQECARDWLHYYEREERNNVL